MKLPTALMTFVSWLIRCGCAVRSFSVATTRPWKDDRGDWKDKTQWHNIIAYGHSFAQLAPRLLKGTDVFVQGELNTREYERTIKVPSGKKWIEHVIQQIAVELKPIRSASSIASATPSQARPTQLVTEDGVPLGASFMVSQAPCPPTLPGRAQ